MLYLLIDNSADEELVIYYSLNTKLVQRNYQHSQGVELLSAIDKCIREAGKKLSDLRGLAVVVGKGRFTATRVAVTIANTIAYALQIPVAATRQRDIAKAVAILKKTPVGQYISAKYSGEANIG